MPVISPNSSQLQVANLPTGAKIFLEGPAGSGKTTAGTRRLLHLLEQGVAGGSMLVLVPQRTLAMPYQEALREAKSRAGREVSLLTAGGLARRGVELFWPLVAEQAGFAQPERPPTFLTLETAQYYMARLVRPLLEEGAFESVTIERNRLYSQIIDNLNKAAVVGFPYQELGSRLQGAWGGEPGQARVYDDAQRCADAFRAYCLAHNLLDFSLQVEVFRTHLWPLPLYRGHLLATYQHLIADNVEEDTPFAHDLVSDWLPDLESALLIYDQDAGYRQFLGADPASAYQLKDLCESHVTFTETLVNSTELAILGDTLAAVLRHSDRRPDATGDPAEVRASLNYDLHRYYPEMLDWVCDEVARLVQEQGVSPADIVVLAPYLSDALRFSLMERLQRQGVPVRSHRPSRALREEPATQCLLTLAALAHPQWGIRPGKFDLAHALVQAIEEMDLVRAQLMAEIVYRVREGRPTLSSFDRINPEMHERISYVLGGRFEGLRIWLDDYTQKPVLPLDHFLGRLFGEVLSQPGYGFHANYDAGEVVANLVESVQKFRWGAQERLPTDGKPLGQEYLEMVEDGVIAAQYVRSWRTPAGEADDAVLLAPAYTFLMGNRPVSYQFWLSTGSRGWFERLYQPLTHPYVLSRHWAGARPWSDQDEFTAGQERLARLSLGLIRRCRRQIFLGLSELGEQGYEQRGPLLAGINQVLQRLQAEERKS